MICAHEMSFVMICAQEEVIVIMFCAHEKS